MSHTDHHDTDPVIAELLDDAFVGAVDVETAARHLWAIHAAAQEQEQVREQARPEPVPSLAGRRIPRTAVPLLALVMVMSSSGVAVAASQGSLPGDVLYPVKRGTERAQLIFARDPVTRAELQLSFARTRLAEITQIAETRPQHVDSLVAEITVTLTEVEQAPPEVAAQVQPLRESIQHEAEVQIASLPPEIGQRVEVAMTSVPTVDAAATTATTAATTASTTTPSDVAEGVATATPTTGSEVPATPVPTPTPTAATPSPDPTTSEEPSTDPSAEPNPEGTETEGSGSAGGAGSESPTATPTQPSTAPTAASGGSGSTAQPSGSPSPSSTPTSNSSEEESSGPVVTARPQPVENPDEGESRAEGEEPTPEPQQEPGAPLGRPGHLGQD